MSGRADTEGPRFIARIAESERDVMDSLQLRYRVFGQELGARLETAAAGVDADHFDLYCRHLVVRDRISQRMVASTRLLSDAGAREAGGFYSESEFDLSAVARLPGRKLEVGRTCVDPEFRNGAVIATLWSRLMETVMHERHDYLFGCASIGLEDGGHYAHSVMAYLTQAHPASPEWQVRSRDPLPVPDRRETAATPPRLPPLLKAYIKLGARVCGEGYWDRDFNCVDVFVLLDVAAMTPRYARHFARPLVSNTLAEAV